MHAPCRMLRFQVSDAQYDECNSEYNCFKTNLTGQRIPLTPYNFLTVAANYAAGVMPKYDVAIETAVLWCIASNKYYLDAKFANCGSHFHSVALAVYVSHRLSMHACNASYSRSQPQNTEWLSLHARVLQFRGDASVEAVLVLPGTPLLHFTSA